MATNPQSFIQPTAQAASPFVPNNGNPNTVYNTAATPFGGQPAGWNTISPFGGTNLADLWSFAPASTALPESRFADPANRFWENPSAIVPAQFSLEQSGAVWPDGSNPFMPPQQQPVPGTGITAPGGVTPDIHPHNPGSGPTPAGGAGGGRPNSGGGEFISIPMANGPSGSSTVSSRPVGEIYSGLNSIVDSINRGMGFVGRDGKFDPVQFLDAITQVIIPGDFYNANVGRMNWPNAVKAVLNSAVPGLGRVAEWIIGKLPVNNPIRNWLEKGQLQNLVDEAYKPESYMNFPQGPSGGLRGPSGGGGGRGGYSWGSGVNVGLRDMELMADKFATFGDLSAV